MAVKKMVAKKPAAAMKKTSPVKQTKLMDKKTVAKKTGPLMQKKKPAATTNTKTSQQKPVYNMSAELAAEIERRTKENKARKLTEVQASSDSTAVANITKGNMFSKQLAGNAAANKTRWRAGFNDQKVFHSQQQGTGMSHQGGTEAFWRQNQVETNQPQNLLLNAITGEYNYNKNETGRVGARGASVYVPRFKGYE